MLDVDRFQAEVGATVELTDVLLLSDGGQTTIGTPTVADARVLAEVLEQGRDDKILVFKYKNKTRYRRRYGHRQDYTRLAIRAIGVGDVKIAEEKPKRTSRKRTQKAEPEPAPEIPEMADEAADVKAEAVEAEAKKPAPQRPRKATDGETKPARAPRVRKAAPKKDAPTEDPAEE